MYIRRGLDGRTQPDGQRYIFVGVDRLFKNSNGVTFRSTTFSIYCLCNSCNRCNTR